MGGRGQLKGRKLRAPSDRLGKKWILKEEEGEGGAVLAVLGKSSTRVKKKDLACTSHDQKNLVLAFFVCPRVLLGRLQVVRRGRHVCE